MEKVVKLEGLDYRPKEYLYFVKKDKDGVYLFRAKMSRAGRK